MASHRGGSIRPLHTPVVVVLVLVVSVTVDEVYMHESQRTGQAALTNAPTDGLVQILFMPRKTSQLDGSITPLHTGVVVVEVAVAVDVDEVEVVVVAVTVDVVVLDVEVVQTPQRTGQCSFKMSPVISTSHKITSTLQSGHGSVSPLHFSGPIVVVVVDVVEVVVDLVDVV